MTEQTPAALLSLIRGAETSRGYDDYSTYAVIAPPKPVTQMTVREVQQWQRKAARAGSKSVAVGGYQMITKTFNGVVEEMGLTGDEIFDVSLQDRMGTQLLARRGYNEWLAGDLTDDQFSDNLAMEWAGLPRATGPKRGRSHYAGDGMNGATVNNATVFEALEAARNGTPWEYKGGGAAGGSRRGVPASEQRRLMLADLHPNENYTGADMEQIGQTPSAVYRSVLDDKAAADAVETPSFWDAAGMAIDEEWLGTNIARQMGRPEFAPDYDFQFTEELWSEVTEGLPAVYQEGLEDATSEAHARALAKELQRQSEVDQKLSSLGWGGTGLRIGAAILDPAALIVSAASEGAAAPFIYGAKVGKVGRFLRAGAAAGAVNAGIDGYLVSQDPTGQWEDIAFSAAAGFVLGGSLGAFRRMPEDDAMMDIVRTSLEDAEVDPAARGTADGSLSAARVPQETNLSPAEQVRIESESAPKTAKPLGAPRIDRVGILKQSENGITRRLAGLLAEDAVGNADGSVNVRGASENVARETRVRLGRFYRDYNEAYKAWRKERGLRWWQHGAQTRREFNSMVGTAVRRELDATTNTHVSKVASRIKREFADLLEFGREQGIRGFDEIKENYNYMVRKHRIAALDDMVAEYGRGNINQLIAGSLISANRKWRNKNPARAAAVEDIDYEDALNIADSYVNSIRSRRYGEFSLNRALSGQDMDTLKMMLDDAGMAPEEVARISDKVRFQVDSSERGRIGNAKWRLDLDETFSMEAFGKDGTKRTIRIEDFLENDAEVLFTSYARSVLGAGYMEEALSGFKVRGADGEMPQHSPSFETVKGYIAKEAQEKGISESDMRSEFRMLDNLYKAVMGQPVEAPSKTREAQRYLRDYNFSRIGGQLGVAQLAEIGNPLGQGGVRVLMQNLPALRKIFWSAKHGGFKDDLFNEIEAIWGFGTDLTRTSTNVKFDDSLGSFEGTDFGSSALTKLDHGLQRAKIGTSVGSGMAHINMVLQRLNSRVLVQRFMDDATGKRGINDKRLRVMGISEELHPRIQEQLRKHVDQAQGLLGRKVKRINIEKWDDLDAKNAFINGVDRWAKKSIQENDVGNMPDLMSYELGKTVFQFRSFMLAAYSKQLLSGLHHRDWETFSSFMTSMMFGGLFYAAQQQVNSIGRSDREEWLEKRLSPESIGKAAFQRAGFSSVLPVAADLVGGFVTPEPIFDYRSSGLKSGGGDLTFVLSNPSADLIDGTIRGARGVTRALLNGDYDYSQEDLKALTKIMLFQNAFGIRNVLAAMGSSLPRYSN